MRFMEVPYKKRSFLRLKFRTYTIFYLLKANSYICKSNKFLMHIIKMSIFAVFLRSMLYFIISLERLMPSNLSKLEILIIF